MSDILQVKNLVQEFKNKQGLIDSLKVQDGKLVRTQKVVHAVNDISFSIGEGEAFSLVGESGCGKSTAARTIIRLLDPVAGDIIYRGENIARLQGSKLLPYRKKIQMIFQDPYSSLDPRQKVKDILMEPILFHKLAPSRKAAETRCYELMERVGLRPEQSDRYPHQFSGGQRQRIGIARALAVEPEFIIADEPVSALDVSIQAQILNLMMDLKDEFHFSYLFISHNLSVVKHISDRLAVMYLGAIVETGTKKDLFEHMQHPYTKLLFSAVPTVGEEPLVEAVEMTGEIPSPIDLPSGCFFHGRCPYAQPICSEQRPELKEVAPGHCVACHLCQGKCGK